MRTGTESGRPRRFTRVGAVAVLSWVLAVVVGSAITWRALAVVDSGERTGVLSQAEVDVALAQARTAVTPAPSATPTVPPTPTTDPSTPVPTAPDVARTWTVPGGIVAVSCRDAAITLLYATPSDGWTVEVGAAGPERVEVELHHDKDETKLTAECVAGTPEHQVDSDDDSGRRSDD